MDEWIANSLRVISRIIIFSKLMLGQAIPYKAIVGKMSIHPKFNPQLKNKCKVDSTQVKADDIEELDVQLSTRVTRDLH